MVLFEIYWSFKGHFLNELHVSFKIFNIWMDNWRIALANLEQVVQKEKGGMNRMI